MTRRHNPDPRDFGGHRRRNRRYRLIHGIADILILLFIMTVLIRVVTAVIAPGPAAPAPTRATAVPVEVRS